VIHTGIPDVNVERSQAREHLRDLIADPLADPVISLVGHMIPGKGHLEIIEIGPRLLEHLPDARIVFVGDVPRNGFAPYRERLKDRVKQLGLAEAIAFLGHRDDALSLIAGSDLVVMPSVSRHHGIETEGFPLLALEALAVGTPIVAYSVGGIPEVIGDCGMLVRPRDREGLKDAIVHVAADRDLRETMSARGRVRAHEHFSMTQMVNGVEGVYESARRR
jgi:glycosyltransferase involved in cell wall biosynthesis